MKLTKGGVKFKSISNHTSRKQNPANKAHGRGWWTCWCSFGKSAISTSPSLTQLEAPPDMSLRFSCSPYLLPDAEPSPFEIGEHLVASSSKIIVIDKVCFVDPGFEGQANLTPDYRFFPIFYRRVNESWFFR
jgi:hypothetical protein